VNISVVGWIDAAWRRPFRKGWLTYHCFAGEWKGYYSIDEIKEDLKGRIIGKTRIRKMLERWLETKPPEPAELGLPSVTAEPPPPSDPPIQDRPEYTIEEYDASFRTELESVYNRFMRTIAERDLDGLLSMVETSRTDEETLRKEMSSDGFVSFSEWMLTVYPQLEQTTFISLKTGDDDFAGYYMAWVPSYSNDYLNLTLIRFEKGGGEWKILFNMSETASAIFQLRKDEDALAKAQEIMRTNPLMILKRPETLAPKDDEIDEPKTPEKLIPLKEEIEAALSTFYGALERSDIEAFLSIAVVSEEDEEKLRKNPRNLSRAILENTPEPSEAIFVKLQARGEHQAGYYFVAPYPQNPSFNFVYLRPFVCHDGKWKMVFSLEHDLAVSLNIARSEGDLVSRAVEAINKIDLLHLEWVMSSLFGEIIQPSASPEQPE